MSFLSSFRQWNFTPHSDTGPESRRIEPHRATSRWRWTPAQSPKTVKEPRPQSNSEQLQKVLLASLLRPAACWASVPCSSAKGCKWQNQKGCPMMGQPGCRGEEPGANAAARRKSGRPWGSRCRGPRSTGRCGCPPGQCRGAPGAGRKFRRSCPRP